MNAEIWTIRRLLQWTTSYFKKYQIKTARLDADILLSHALGCTRLELYLDPDRPVDKEPRAQFKSLVKRRAKHEPIAYLIGKKEFRSIEFKVDHRVLIPRPETERMIDIVKRHLQTGNRYSFADVGTGSGCIAVSLATEFPKSRIIALDSSRDALEVARENIERKNLSPRIECIRSNWLDALKLPRYSLYFHGILSNPPYIPTKVLRSLPPEISRYEPSYALDGGEDGLNAYRDIARNAYPRLCDNGFLLFEIFEENAEKIKTLLHSMSFTRIQIYKDDMKADRFIIGFRKAG